MDLTTELVLKQKPKQKNHTKKTAKLSPENF